MGTSLWWFFRNNRVGGEPRADPEHAGGITYLIWFGNSSGSPKEELESVAGHIDIWKTLLDLLPLLPDHRRQKNGQMGRVKRNVSMRQTNALLVSFVSFGLQCGRWDSGCTVASQQEGPQFESHWGMAFQFACSPCARPGFLQALNRGTPEKWTCEVSCGLTCSPTAARHELPSSDNSCARALRSELQADTGYQLLKCDMGYLLLLLTEKECCTSITADSWWECFSLSKPSMSGWQWLVLKRTHILDEAEV